MSPADESRAHVAVSAYPGLEHAPVAFYVSTLAGRLLTANAAFLGFFGFPTVEAVNEAGGTVVLYATGEGRRRFVEALGRGREVVGYEVDLRTRRGEIRTVLLHGRLEDERIVGAVIDITERKAAERSLARRNRDLAALYAVDMAVGGRLDPSAFLQAALEAAVEAVGAQSGVIHLAEGPGGALGLSAHHGLPPELPAHLHRVAPGTSVVARALTERGVRVVSVGDYPEDAPLRAFFEPHDVLAAAPLVSAGEAVGSLAVLRSGPEGFGDDDLALLGAIGHRLGAAVANARLYRSVERQLEETAWLHEQREHQALFLERILDALGHPFHVIDAEDYTVRLVNEASRKVGVQVGSRCYATLHGRDRPCFEDDHPCALDVVRRTGRPAVVEHVHEDADGGRRLLEIHAHPIIDAAGRLTQISEYAFDATSRKEFEVHLAQTDRLAAIGTLAAGVVHEINTPLAYAFANLSEALETAERLGRSGGESREGHEELGELLTDAYEGVRRVVGIVRNIKGFARVDEEEGAAIDVIEALDLAADVARHEYKYRARLVRSYEDDLPEVAGSAGRLSQVFLNLIVNAAQAIEPGRPDENEIRLRARAEGDDVIVEIADTGCGIAPSRLQRIFEPFFTTKPRGVGTGLGLAICRDIVEGLGGRIEVESRPGEGSTFRVRLRAVLGKATDGEDELRRPAFAGAAQRL